MMSTIVNKIESILKSKYSTENFVELMREIFDSMTIVAPNRFREERSNFSSHIVGSTHIGNYATPERKKIAIFAVQLRKESYVEGSRSTQRSYAKKLIEGGNCNAAIIAFYTEGEPKWRLSFVRLDYEMTIEKGKLKTKENITPAKRYSFLVGEDEPSHTAIERFRQFIIDKNFNPSLDEIEEAFSVEKVTKEFFNLYCEKFYQLQEYLVSNEDFIEESKRCGFTSEQYAKKLMGQIVFLYFLQKKGWLGVNVWPQTITEKEYKNIFFVSGAQGRIIKEHLPKIYIKQADGTYHRNTKALDMISDDDEEVIAKHMVRKETWGDGSKKFLRTIFEFSKTHKGHFFENYLEPLFYDTLNKNRGDMGYCPALHARVPFLSGGLFEPLDGYDWKSSNFDIPDEIFSNKKDKNDINGDGILDIFDRYNFTMSEDEPMEREVAIDPEMLGKIFENLLEVKDRKSKGAFYTPREIVHYMCQESLINYLVRKTSISEDALRNFILYGDFMKDEDTEKTKREGNGAMSISDEIFKINEEGTIVVNRLKDIDDALASVHVADPAVGSGAFPLGMVNEIIRARTNITAYMTIGMNSNSKRLLYKNERSQYCLKKEAIKNSIFAVDIEPSAVDITQLRLWLSLVIDDEITPDAANELEGHKNPLPLPNLECNILCGNSLMDEFMGIKLINESDILHTAKENSQISMGQDTIDAILKHLLNAQDELFKCEDSVKKIELKKQIQSYKDMIVKEQLSCTTEETKEAYRNACKMASKPFILWQLDFARVFRDNGGFDIVIGNPPYIDSETMMNSGLEEQRTYIAQNYTFCKGNWDIYIAFFEKGFKLLNNIGYQIYITPDKWISKPFGDKMRIEQIPYITQILAAGRDVFETALVDSIVTSFSKIEDTSIKVFEMNMKNKSTTYLRTVSKNVLTEPYALDIVFSNYIDLIEKMGSQESTIGTFYSCENACATSDCYILKKILESFETEDEYDSSKHYKVINTGTIGRYVSRWGYSPMKYLKDKYKFPFVKKESFKETFPNSYGQKADKKKMIIKGLTLLDASLDIQGEIIPGKSTMMIAIDDIEELKIVCAFINSILSIFYIKQKYSSSSYNGGINFTKDMINNLPYPALSQKQKNYIISLVDSIISEKEKDNDADTSELEELINEVYFKVFDFSDEEVLRVKDSFKK